VPDDDRLCVSGAVITDLLSPLAVTLPSMIVASRIGSRLYYRISDRAFSCVILGFLAAAGLVLVISSLARFS
jgi:uncharacterized membrane protein YfcA